MARPSAIDGTPLSFATPTTRFGDGVVESLGDVLIRRGIDVALVVSDDGVEAAGVLDRVLDEVSAEVVRYRAATEPGTGDFAGLPDEPVDGVLAVGGGSCLDAAKVAALLGAHGGEPADYLGEGRVPGPVLPLVAVPTTSGTGSQATQTAVLSHEGVKRGISDEHLRFDDAVVDPTLTVDLPRPVTAASGFDAFVHALESLTARDYRWVPDRPIRYQGANPVTRPLSRRALRLVHGALERAVFDGDDREARRTASLGAHLAGVAFSNAGLGAVHALASAVGAMTGRPHGECLAAALRPGLAYNRPVRRDEYAAAARLLGVAGRRDRPEEAADALLDECDRLAASIGLPTSFRELGLDRSRIDDVVDRTLVQERRLATNPRAVTDDLRAVVTAGFE